MVRLEGDCITLDIWIMLWNYLAFVDPLQCYRSMTFIGIDVSFESAFKFHSAGQSMSLSALQNKKNRHILQCLVLGDSTLVSRLLQQLIESDMASPGTSVVVPVKHKVTQQHIVIFTPLEPSELPGLLSSPEQLQKVDFIAVLGQPRNPYLDSVAIPVIEVTVREGLLAPESQLPHECEVDLVNKNHQPLLCCLNQVIANP